MKRISRDKNSIAYKLTVFMIILIFGQSVLLISTLVVGGVLDQAQQNAFQAFSEKVNNRKGYVQQEMKNRWTNMDPYLEKISGLLSILDESEISIEERNKNFFDKSAQVLISMLRTTMATGSFIILDDNVSSRDTHSALYFRDYDPILNDDVNNDLYLILGDPNISKRLKIPMDGVWKYSLLLDENNKNFYNKPYYNADLSIDSRALGYWSTPFKMSPNDLPIITYTMPLFDTKGEVHGVIGIEISVSYFKEFIPATDLLLQDSLGYLIAIGRSLEDGISPLITTGALQERMLQKNEKLAFISKDKSKKIYMLKNHNSSEKIYACVEKMGLYNYNTPFEEEQWYIVGMMGEKNLLNFVYKIQRIIFMSFIGSIILGAIGGYFFSYKFTKPIVNLAKKVRETDHATETAFEKIGLSEIDDLSSAMEAANKNLLESSVKMSKIINLVNVRIGAFEYKKESQWVFATDQLQHILSLDEYEAERLYKNKDLFVQMLQQILNRKESEEEYVYKISHDPEKWVRIKMIANETSTLGVVSDVTEEIQEIKKIKFDRDYDSLTKLYNRGAFERKVNFILGQNDLGVVALVMFDLDYLKEINDTYGHKWGDIYIKTTGELLSSFSEHSIVGRRSGDEFYAFVYGFESREEIRSLVSNFYKRLQSRIIIFPDGSKKTIMISAGLAWYVKDILTYDELLNCADSALYDAKNFCKGQWCEFREK